MTFAAAKIVILLMSVVFAGWAWLTIQTEIARHRTPRSPEWNQFVTMPAIAMVLALGVNALAFLNTTNLEHEIAAADPVYVYHEDGSYETVAPSDGDRFFDLISVIAGTLTLMWLLRRALTDDRIYRLERPRAASWLAQKLMVEDLMKRHWLAVAGVGAVFGVASGPGVVMLLAVELTFMWGCCCLLLRILEPDAVALLEELEREAPAPPNSTSVAQIAQQDRRAA